MGVGSWALAIFSILLVCLQREHDVLAAGSSGRLSAVVVLRAGSTNGDGEISRTEFLAAAVARFRWMDANSNGELTELEFAAGDGG